MLSFRRLRSAACVLVLAVLASGCYYAEALTAATNGDPVPWFCHPTNFNSVTGPGMGTVNWYAGQTRSPLPYDTCKSVAAQMDLAKAYALEYPTLADAEDAEFTSTFPFISGMGTHHGRNAITPALLADPTFDRFNPIIPGSIIDDKFEPKRPEFLQYNGNEDDAVLVGMSYYVRTNTGLPPAGFAGNNDWWHHHLTLCLNPATAQARGVNTSESTCASQGGVNVYLDDYYMLHVWLVDGIEFENDVHAPFHPCIKSTGAIFDMDDPCHQQGSTGPPGIAAASPPAPAPTRARRRSARSPSSTISPPPRSPRRPRTSVVLQLVGQMVGVPPVGDHRHLLPLEPDLPPEVLAHRHPSRVGCPPCDGSPPPSSVSACSSPVAATTATTRDDPDRVGPDPGVRRPHRRERLVLRAHRGARRRRLHGGP